MDMKSRGFTLMEVFLFLLFSANFLVAFSAANQHLNTKKPITPYSSELLGSSGSIAFRVKGNVYPLGEYAVTIGIGNPPKPFDLDIDTGSDLTWVQCDAPCKRCTKPRDELYKPRGNNNIVRCGEFLCESAPNHRCTNPNEQCDYMVKYADNESSLGLLLRDYIPLRLTDGTPLRPLIALGCGYDQQFSGRAPSSIGVLGLGNGKASILSQLHGQGMVSNVVGHCLSGRGGGFLFFGDQLIPKSGIVWTPMLHSSSGLNHYITGPADLFFNGRPTSVKGLQLTFDSGSSYTYFNSQAYKVLVNLITNDLKGKPLKIATEDQTLSLCWKGAKPFRSISDVSNYFKPLVLIFTNSRNLQLQVPPQAYLIITVHGNVCLGILDGTQIGLGNDNIIGDISLLDKLVVYDNERQQIGWVPANCDRTSQVMNQSIVISSFTGN